MANTLPGINWGIYLGIYTGIYPGKYPECIYLKVFTFSQIYEITRNFEKLRTKMGNKYPYR